MGALVISAVMVATFAAVMVVAAGFDVWQEWRACRRPFAIWRPSDGIEIRGCDGRRLRFASRRAARAYIWRVGSRDLAPVHGFRLRVRDKYRATR